MAWNFYVVCTAILPVTELGGLAHPKSRSLGGHVETNTIGFEMGWRWVAAWLPELACL